MIPEPQERTKKLLDRFRIAMGRFKGTRLELLRNLNTHLNPKEEISWTTLYRWKNPKFKGPISSESAFAIEEWLKKIAP